MTTCEHCEIIKDDLKEKLYEDTKVIAILNPEPTTKGHVLVMPKEHFPIIENVPDDLVEHTFFVANKVSMALFETLHMQGTNVIVNNGIAAGQESAHFMVNIIPRMENDGIDFTWQPKQLTQEEIASVEMRLKEEIGAVTQEKAEQAVEELKEVSEGKAIKKDEDKENYQLKHLDRIP